jgi:hypothetical protein
MAIARWLVADQLLESTCEPKVPRDLLCGKRFRAVAEQGPP